MLAADHIKDHSKKMMIILTNAHTHSKKQKNKKEWKKCIKTIKKLTYNPLEEEKNAQIVLGML